MSQKSWHLNRRTFLRGTGVALALPMLECMGKPVGTRPKSTPPRLCCVFFANGVSLPPVDHADHKKWNWFPLGEGADYRLTQTLKPLEPFRQDMTILGGLSHPLGRLLVGHATADIWLTGGDVRGSEYRNSISFDQRVAREQGKHTRFPSLVLSSNGGVGYKTRTTTVSFNRSGEAIPAESNPRQIFERLFSGGGTASLRARKRQLQQDRRIVDLVLEDSRNLKRRLGHHDQQKLEEYLEAVHEIERRLERTEAWLAAPRPTVDPGQLNLTVSQNSPRDYIRTMYDLMLLAFQTDTTEWPPTRFHRRMAKGCPIGSPPSRSNSRAITAFHTTTRTTRAHSSVGRSTIGSLLNSTPISCVGFNPCARLREACSTTLWYSLAAQPAPRTLRATTPWC